MLALCRPQQVHTRALNNLRLFFSRWKYCQGGGGGSGGVCLSVNIGGVHNFD